MCWAPTNYNVLCKALGFSSEEDQLGLCLQESYYSRETDNWQKKKKKKINNKRIIACKKCYEKYEECCVEYRKGWCYLGQPVKASPGKWHLNGDLKYDANHLKSWGNIVKEHACSTRRRLIWVGKDIRHRRSLYFLLHATEAIKGF